MRSGSSSLHPAGAGGAGLGEPDVAGQGRVRQQVAGRALQHHADLGAPQAGDLGVGELADVVRADADPAGRRPHQPGRAARSASTCPSRTARPGRASRPGRWSGRRRPGPPRRRPRPGRCAPPAGRSPPVQPRLPLLPFARRWTPRSRNRPASSAATSMPAAANDQVTSTALERPASRGGASAADRVGEDRQPVAGGPPGAGRGEQPDQHGRQHDDEVPAERRPPVTRRGAVPGGAARGSPPTAAAGPRPRPGRARRARARSRSRPRPGGTAAPAPGPCRSSAARACVDARSRRPRPARPCAAARPRRSGRPGRARPRPARGAACDSAVRSRYSRSTSTPCVAEPGQHGRLLVHLDAAPVWLSSAGQDGTLHGAGRRRPGPAAARRRRRPPRRRSTNGDGLVTICRPPVEHATPGPTRCRATGRRSMSSVGRDHVGRRLDLPHASGRPGRRRRRRAPNSGQHGKR